MPIRPELNRVAEARLRNQCLIGHGFAAAEEVVKWLGAVQAQDYPGAKWALALRMAPTTDAEVERAFADGRILRTHVMRPTWHFVTPADIRWMLALTAPRVRATLASYDRKLGIDAAVIARSNKAIAAALRGGAQLTRQELKVVLQKSQVRTDSVQRLAHLTIHAELDGIICSGALRGKQFTYALLDERAAANRPLSRDEALAELTRRYFTSHGPAQIQDFVWWSGLKASDARAGLEMARHDLAEDVIDGKRYWFPASMRSAGRARRQSAHLLPLYDEYLIAYRDRTASLDPELWTRIARRDPFSASILVNGRVVGGWRRTLRAKEVAIALDVPRRLNNSDKRLLGDAARRFSDFLGLSAVIFPSLISHRSIPHP